jgi:hypothetical protein
MAAGTLLHRPEGVATPAELLRLCDARLVDTQSVAGRNRSGRRGAEQDLGKKGAWLT